MCSLCIIQLLMLITLLLYSLAHLILLTCMFKLGLGGVFINKIVLFLYCQFVYCTVLKLGSSYGKKKLYVFAFQNFCIPHI